MRLDVNRGCHSEHISPRINTSTRTKSEVQPSPVFEQKRELLSHQVFNSYVPGGANGCSNSPQSRSWRHIRHWLMEYLVNQDVISDRMQRGVSSHELSEPMLFLNKFRVLAHRRSPS